MDFRAFTKYFALAFFATIFFSSCLVQHPKYASYHDVKNVTTEMTFEELSDSLKVEPHYIKSMLKDGTTIYVFKYRLCDIKRVPIIMRKNHGFEMESDFVDLLVTVDTDGMVTNLETCIDCNPPKEKTTIIDFQGIANGITNLITVTLPALIILLSRQN